MNHEILNNMLNETSHVRSLTGDYINHLKSQPKLSMQKVPMFKNLAEQFEHLNCNHLFFLWET